MVLFSFGFRFNFGRMLNFNIWLFGIRPKHILRASLVTMSVQWCLVYTVGCCYPDWGCWCRNFAGWVQWSMEVRILARIVEMMAFCALDHSFSSIRFITVCVCLAGYTHFPRSLRGKKDTIP